MSKEDIKWIEKCKKNPGKYRIYIGIDSICVEDTESEGIVHTFNSFGYEFAKELLCCIGCNAEFV